MSVLHIIGDALREALLQIPMGAARALFLMVPILLLVWVLALPRAQTTPSDRPTRCGENLKWWAALALLCQIALYLLL